MRTNLISHIAYSPSIHYMLSPQNVTLHISKVRGVRYGWLQGVCTLLHHYIIHNKLLQSLRKRETRGKYKRIVSSKWYINSHIISKHHNEYVTMLNKIKAFTALAKYQSNHGMKESIVWWIEQHSPLLAPKIWPIEFLPLRMKNLLRHRQILHNQTRTFWNTRPHSEQCKYQHHDQKHVYRCCRSSSSSH